MDTLNFKYRIDLSGINLKKALMVDKDPNFIERQVVYIDYQQYEVIDIMYITTGMSIIKRYNLMPIS